MLDLTAALLVVPAEWTGPRLQAARVLVEEVEARSGVRWPLVHARQPAGVPAVVLAEAPGAPPGGPARPAPSGPVLGPEGYRIAVRPPEGGAPDIRVEGRDARGVLFAVGCLLRHLHMGPGRVGLPAPLHVHSSPRLPLRGHQLGYRPKNNTYDAWSPAQFERYIRELALFGANTIELLPPRTDDADNNALMRVSKGEMLARLTATLARYGLGAGLWYPLMAANYRDPDTAAAETAAADAVFALCARLDSVFVPGGDPGHTPPDVLCAFLGRLADVLRGRHPQAELWISGQGFRPPQLAELFRLLQEQQPGWLTGMVYGPWTACTLAELREALPERYALRLYPDIAHTIHCQFPVPAWDPAFAATLGREPINPLPLSQARILRRMAPGTVGFVTYSEGVNDDVNKFIWTAVGWDPDADLGEVLRQYARLLAAPRHADALAQALFALERNWQGPLLTNTQVPLTLEQLQAIERAAAPDEAGAWRLQSALYRGYYDAYVQRRLVASVAREARAGNWIARSSAAGADAALQGARQALAAPVDDVAPGWREHIHGLADRLFAGIGLQLSVSRHRASAEERGANLDALDAPLGDGPWLAATLDGIAALPTEAERAGALAELSLAHSPGPGGFLDDLGHEGAQPHLVGAPVPPDDPAFLRSVLLVPTPAARPGAAPLPQLWRTAAETLYGVPLVLAYSHLDPRARYRVRVLYHGRYRAAVSLEAGGIRVHGPLRPGDPPTPVTFALPAEATAGGSLVLTWRLEEGRGIQVAAVWLLRDEDDHRADGGRGGGCREG